MQRACGAAGDHREHRPGDGSGELPVLATPAVAALVEKTCWQAIAPELELGMTTVGTSLQLAHTAPTPIGMVVQCDCEVLEVTDRRVRFGFRVYDDVTEVARRGNMNGTLWMPNVF